MAGAFSAIFTECQRSIATHKKCISIATKLLVENPKTIQDFINCVDRVLLVDKRHPAVERCVSFIGNLVSTYSADTADDRKPLWSPLLTHLLERSNVKDASVRFRACQITSEVMSVLPEEVEIDDALWDAVSGGMIIRTKDKAAITRSYAVSALARIQDPQDSEDPVIQEYIRLLSTDSAKEVRKAVLVNIGISKQTLPYILQRSRDMSDDIRKETYQLIGRKVDVRALTIAQRQQLLEDGLQDRSCEVRKAVVNMIAGWLNVEANDGSSPAEIVRLLRFLDIENDGESVACMVIRALYKENLLRIPPLDLSDLTAETALLWRVICELWKEHKDPQLESLPELSQLCRLIAQSLSDTFVVRQLVLMAKFVDLADEVGRRNLNALVCQLLSTTQTPLAYVSPLLELLSSLHSSKDFTSIALEIISELRYPLYSEGDADAVQKGIEGGDSEEGNNDAANTHKNDNHRILAMQARLHDLNTQLAALNSKQAKQKSSEDKKMVANLRRSLEKDKHELEDGLATLLQRVKEREENESKIWCQSLDVALFVLQRANGMREHAGVREMHAVMLAKGLAHPHGLVRARGVSCAVLYCLLDYTAACSHVPIFLELLRNDLPAIQLTVIKGLFDLIAHFGQSLLQDLIELQCDQLLGLLSSYLVHDDEEFRYAAAEGFAKLFMADIATSPQQLMSLVLLFFNPTTADDLELRQCLSVFFTAFACSNFDVHSALIQAAFVPTLKTIAHAPSSSPIKKIPLLHAAQFMLALLDNSNHKTSSPATLYNHAKIAVELAHEILANPKDNKEFCKVLNYCNVTGEDQGLVKVLEFLVEEITSQTTIRQDKLISKAISKFAANLQRIDATPHTALTPSKVDKIKQHMNVVSANYDKEDRLATKSKLPRKLHQKKAVHYESSESDETDETEEDEEEIQLRRRAPSTRKANIIARNKMKDLSGDLSNGEESKDENPPTNPSKRTTRGKVVRSNQIDNSDTGTDSEASTECAASMDSESENELQSPERPTTERAHNLENQVGSYKESLSRDCKPIYQEIVTNTSKVLSIPSRVRQVSLYDSTDDESDTASADEPDPRVADQANKENQPDNGTLQQNFKTPKISAAPITDTTKRMRCLELHQEIGDLLSTHDDTTKQIFLQQTTLEVGQLLAEISPPIPHLSNAQHEPTASDVPKIKTCHSKNKSSVGAVHRKSPLVSAISNSKANSASIKAPQKSHISAPVTKSPPVAKSPPVTKPPPVTKAPPVASRAAALTRKPIQTHSTSNPKPTPTPNPKPASNPKYAKPIVIKSTSAVRPNASPVNTISSPPTTSQPLPLPSKLAPRVPIVSRKPTSLL